VSEAQEYATHIADLLESFGPCESRRMFGGCGIFHPGLMFGLIADGSLYPEADKVSRPLFSAEGFTGFSYIKKDRELQLSCLLAPEELFDDQSACLNGARLAFEAALRNPARKKKGSEL